MSKNDDNKFIVTPRRAASYGETTVVSARLPKELVNSLDDVVDKTGRSRNELIIMSLEYALSNLEIPED